MAVVTHCLQLGADHHLRRFLFDERIRGRLCAQLETLAAATGVAAALDVEPCSNDHQSAAFRERYEWVLKHWDEVERLAQLILGRHGER